MTKPMSDFKPGDKAPVSGIYDVIHDKLDGDDHAQIHPVVALRDETFPRCRGCHDWVRFRLHQAAEHLGAHSHFER